MDTTAGLLNALLRPLRRAGTPLLLIALALLVLAFVLTLAGLQMLVPVSEPIVSAPIRWR